MPSIACRCPGPVGEIPIDVATQARSFVHGRFSDVGSAPDRYHQARRHPKTFTLPAIRGSLLLFRERT